MHIRLENDVAAKIRLLAKAESRSLAQQVNHLLRQTLAAQTVALAEMTGKIRKP